MQRLWSTISRRVPEDCQEHFDYLCPATIGSYLWRYEEKDQQYPGLRHQGQSVQEPKLVESAMTVPFRFFDLPGELQVRILGHVDAPSMLACRKANSKLTSTIDDDVGLRYKLELEIAGMIDGPPGGEGSSLSERLNALRAFRKAWACGEHPLHEVALAYENAYNMTWYDPPAMAISMAHIEWHQREGTLKVYRPLGSFCGLASREDVFEGLSLHHVEQGVPNTGLKGYEVDVAQNLLVYWYGIFDQGPILTTLAFQKAPFRPTIGFHALEPTFQRHPCATHPTITSCFETALEHFPYIKIQVLGDLVGWNMHSGDGWKTDMLVINWKTGAIVWHLHADVRTPHVKLISETQVVLVQCDDPSLHLFTINPAATADSPILTLDDALCTLRFPSCWERAARVQMWSDIGFSPAYPSGTPYYFMHDPDLTLLVLNMRLEYAVDHIEDGSEAVDNEDDPEDRTVSENLLLLIPIATLLPFYPDSLASAPTDSRPASNASPGSAGELLRSRTVPWENWGTHGTRLLFVSRTAATDPDVYAPSSLLGSCISTTRYDPSQGSYVVNVYEAHPLVNVILPSPRDGKSGVKSESCVGDTAVDDPGSPSDDETSDSATGDYVDSKTGRSHIHTTYPYRSTTRIVEPYEWEDLHFLKGNARDILLTHDGLVRMMVKPRSRD